MLLETLGLGMRVMKMVFVHVEENIVKMTDNILHIKMVLEKSIIQMEVLLKLLYVI